MLDDVPVVAASGPDAATDDGILQLVCQNCDQITVDYLVGLVRQDRLGHARRCLLDEGLGEDVAAAFVEQVQGHMSWDIHRVRTVKDKLQLSDAEFVDLARAVLRVYCQG